MTTNQDLHELTAAYALDALDEGERTAYEAHLDGCEQCQADLAEFDGTVGVLGLAAEGPAPPGDLRDRILAAARDEGPSTVVAIGSGRRRFYTVGALAAAAAAALAIGLYAVYGNGNGKSARVAIDNGVAQLTVNGLSDAPTGKAYEIWVIQGTAPPKPAGLFFNGGKQKIRLTPAPPKGSTVAITLEQATGARAPTTKVLVSTTVEA